MTTEATQPLYPAKFVEALTAESIKEHEVGPILAEFQMNLSLGEVGEKALALVVTDESQTDLMKEARSLRLEIKTERVRIEKVRKEIKEPYLRKTQVIDGLARIARRELEAAEDHLLKQEQFALIKRQERRDKQVAERVELLQPYVEDPKQFPLADMSDEAFATLYTNCKESHENKLKAEAAEKARLEAEENERLLREKAVREENERLKAEAEANAEKLRKEEAARQEAERKQREAEDEARRQREAKEAAEQQARDAEKAKKAKVHDFIAKKYAGPDRERLAAYADGIEAALDDVPEVEIGSAATRITALQASIRETLNTFRGNLDDLRATVPASEIPESAPEKDWDEMSEEEQKAFCGF